MMLLENNQLWAGNSNSASSPHLNMNYFTITAPHAKSYSLFIVLCFKIYFDISAQHCINIISVSL